MTEWSTWSEIKARQAAGDSRPAPERDANRAAVSLRFDVAQLVYDLRASAGLTQRQLADRMGTTQSVISRLEQAVGYRRWRCSGASRPPLAPTSGCSRGMRAGQTRTCQSAHDRQAAPVTMLPYYERRNDMQANTYR